MAGTPVGPWVRIPPTRVENMKVLAVDSHKRVSLGKLASYKYYLVNVETDGTIVLIPAAVHPIAGTPVMSQGKGEVR